MEKSMSQIVVGSVVKRHLRDIKEDPERGIRNLVDMALQFSEGRFQKNFFSMAQSMLQNEKSAYYDLLRNTISYADVDRLYTFGMNLGYNGCTVGAQRIRANEKKLNCTIPWTVIMQLDTMRFSEHQQQYQRVIRDGERLGIYTWMLFAGERPLETLPLIKEHEDSAFILFCEPEELSPAVLDSMAEAHNLMLAVRYRDNISDLCAKLREMGVLYSVWYPYGRQDMETVISGDLFCELEQLLPIFTALLPEPECPEGIRCQVSQSVRQARGDQLYHTLLWELQGDNLTVDSIISDDSCAVCFDREGCLCTWSRRVPCLYNNLYQSSLTDILKSAGPRNPRCAG